MSGTGKSEATNFLKDQFNFDLFYFGGIVLNEVKKRGLEINNENEKMVREDLRRQHGNGVLAKIASETIAKTDSTILLDDDCHSLYGIQNIERVISGKFYRSSYPFR